MTPGPIRQRSRQACLPCRTRKRKCDGGNPCSTCTGYGYECSYGKASPRHPPAPPQAAIATSPTTTQEPVSAPSTNTNRNLNVNIHTPETSTGIYEPRKSRYMSQSSSVAFPRLLGLALRSTEPPRLHSFAYHTGMRREASCSIKERVVDMISWEEVEALLDVFRQVIHPVFGFLELDSIYRKAESHWNGTNQGLPFEAIIASLTGVASLFSNRLDQDRETQIISHAKNILEDSTIARLPSVEHITAWILRTIYIRSTGRPHMAWLSSCTTMHLVEATGLHRGEMVDVEGKIRTAAVARCLSIMISYDYGRSVVDLRPAVEQEIQLGEGDYTPQLVNLVKLIPLDTRDTRENLTSALRGLISTQTDHEFLTLVKTDLCFSIYRRLRLLDQGMQAEELEQIISVGSAALPAARTLLAQHHPWWNTIGTVFQFICVLLAIDTTESLSKVGETMETLEMVAGHLNTHLANEALDTARLLIRASLKKKRQGIEILEGIAGVSEGDDQWQLDGFNWDAFLQPSLPEFMNFDL